jgi:multidrug resistance protein, MATE family
MEKEKVEKAQSLTIFPEGSIRELWSISLPLMISTLASLFMIFVDRIFLARYSLDALNASVNAGTWAWAFFGGMGMLTAMSEVFVSQYNGAKKYNQIGSAVWQMIWVAIFSFLFFVPMGMWAGPLLYSGTPHEAIQTDYFRILMVFGPCYALMTALSGFFIGRGRTKILILLAVVANIINIFLDWILIFGVKGIIPEMGVRGAAIATCFGYVFEAAFLLYLFLKKENREQFGTGNWRFDSKIFARSIRVGLPQAVFYMLEIIGFAVFYQMMTSISQLHITVSSICQSILILLSFFLDGLSRGVAAVAGNFIGAKRFEMLKSVMKAGISLQIFFSIFISFFFLIDPKSSISFLFPGQFEAHAEMWTKELGLPLYDMLKTCLLCSFLYLSLEGVRWVFAGLLTAAGDTLFLLIAGALSVWLFLLLPVYFIVVKNAFSVEFAWILTVIYSAVCCSIYWLRFKKGKWKEINLVN